IHRLFPNNRKIVVPPFSVYRSLDPLTINPRPNLLELPKVYFRIEVGSKVSSVRTRIYIQDVYRVYFIEIVFLCVRRVRVDDARVKSNAKNRIDADLLTGSFLFPFIIGVPRGILTNLIRILVYSRIHVGNFRANTRFKDRHIDIGRSEVDDDGRMRRFDELHHLRYIHRIYLTRIQLPSFVLEAFFMMNAFDNGITLLAFARSYTDIPQDIVMLRTFVRRNMCYCPGSDYEYIRFTDLSTSSLDARSHIGFSQLFHMS